MYLLRRIEAVLVKELNNMKVLPVTHKHSTCGRDNKKLQGGLLKRVKSEDSKAQAQAEIDAASKNIDADRKARAAAGGGTGISSLLTRKRKNAPSRKKSLGYYNKANKTGTGAKAGGGMSAKGVAKYRRDNPGSKLKTAVTTPPSKLKKGSKAAKRRKAFCARSRSWKSERGRAARRRWNC